MKIGDKYKTNDFDQKVIEATGDPLRCSDITTVQVNVGLRCNLECVHCHVASSPKRTETMNWETMEAVIDAARRAGARCVDITGGAPELNPDFRRFVSTLRAEGFDVMVRTNLTVLLEPGMETMAEFLRDHQVELVASLPCYLEQNVDGQRGQGVYRDSIAAIRMLNDLGYGIDPALVLSLVYNPTGPSLPPSQAALEADYRRELDERFGITFTRLFTITNMPIGRFIGQLRRENREREYVKLLEDTFNPRTLAGLMCRHQINVDWDGYIYDCDFNLALKLTVDHGAPAHIRDFDPAVHGRRRIVTGKHCFGCTAGCGSSCGGALA